MTPQELADELARLAGWECGCVKNLWGRPDSDGRVVVGHGQGDHPYPVGCLDALEAFRRERGWVLGALFRFDDACKCYIEKNKMPLSEGQGADHWSAYASALVAAAKEESN